MVSVTAEKRRKSFRFGGILTNGRINSAKTAVRREFATELRVLLPDLRILRAKESRSCSSRKVDHPFQYKSHTEFFRDGSFVYKRTNNCFFMEYIITMSNVV